MTEPFTGQPGPDYSERTETTRAARTGRPWRVEATSCRPNVILCLITLITSLLSTDVISTVGPRGEHPEVLQRAYRNCLRKMLELKLKTIVIYIDKFCLPRLQF